MVAVGAIVGGRYSSQRGSMAKRLITSNAPAAFSSRTVTRPASLVWTPRLPSTSVIASSSAARPSAWAEAAGGGGKGLVGSYQTCCAGTVTT